VRRRGETHYFVTRKGLVYRIIDRNRIATHAGRSMWNGERALDNASIGIEVVGYHDRDITPAQYDALRELLRQLKSIYRIPDDSVLTHSMVAYGRPNRYHAKEHRGRKRCGMVFAKPEARIALGLTPDPIRDVDVEVGRLAVADTELHEALYASASASSPAEPEAGPGEAQSSFNGGDQGFEGFLEIGKDGTTARDLAGDAYNDERTIYFFPDGLIRTGRELSANKKFRALMENPPDGTRLLVGYVYGGHVQSRRPPSRIAGVRWNYPSTYYRLPDGRTMSGDEIENSAVPERTLIFYQR